MTRRALIVAVAVRYTAHREWEAHRNQNLCAVVVDLRTGGTREVAPQRPSPFLEDAGPAVTGPGAVLSVPGNVADGAPIPIRGAVEIPF